MNAFEREYAMAKERKENPQQGSYTTYLYEKGLEKILKKVGEESTEVVVAALSQSDRELVGELCDLYYH
ncbi:MAG: phosphoribosyl-ATP diphosphatase, partial [Erysipelotrichaceae bacterium]|nr:phosphoribosyl-ATP diphosphatase [Erysipelotrichaceae bacterium]